MKLYEYGIKNEKKVLFFAACILQPYWAYNDVILELSKKYHVYVMSADGHDSSIKGDFSSVEQNINELIKELSIKKVSHFDGAYGLSMGGSMLMRFLAISDVSVDKAVIDGGIMPYTYPKFICKLILIRDFIFAYVISHNRYILEKLFPPHKYTIDGHDSKKDYDALMKFYATYSNKTIKNAFWSANNYELPNPAPIINTEIQYWCAEYEIKHRKLDMKFVANYFPQTKFCKVSGYGHGELMMVHPKEFCRFLTQFFGF